jgi:hypothetical protein
MIKLWVVWCVEHSLGYCPLRSCLHSRVLSSTWVGVNTKLIVVLRIGGLPGCMFATCKYMCGKWCWKVCGYNMGNRWCVRTCLYGTVVGNECPFPSWISCVGARVGSLCRVEEVKYVFASLCEVRITGHFSQTSMPLCSIYARCGPLVSTEGEELFLYWNGKWINCVVATDTV